MVGVQRYRRRFSLGDEINILLNRWLGIINILFNNDVFFEKEKRICSENVVNMQFILYIMIFILKKINSFF